MNTFTDRVHFLGCERLCTVEWAWHEQEHDTPAGVDIVKVLVTISEGLTAPMDPLDALDDAYHRWLGKAWTEHAEQSRIRHDRRQALAEEHYRWRLDR